MKKSVFEIKRRIIAIALAAITVASVGTMSVTSAYAAQSLSYCNVLSDEARNNPRLDTESKIDEILSKLNKYEDETKKKATEKAAEDASEAQEKYITAGIDAFINLANNEYFEAAKSIISLFPYGDAISSVMGLVANAFNALQEKEPETVQKGVTIEDISRKLDEMSNSISGISSQVTELKNTNFVKCMTVIKTLLDSYTVNANNILTAQNIIDDKNSTKEQIENARKSMAYSKGNINTDSDKFKSDLTRIEENLRQYMRCMITTNTDGQAESPNAFFVYYEAAKAAAPKLKSGDELLAERFTQDKAIWNAFNSAVAYYQILKNLYIENSNAKADEYEQQTREWLNTQASICEENAQAQLKEADRYLSKAKEATSKEAAELTKIAEECKSKASEFTKSAEEYTKKAEEVSDADNKEFNAKFNSSKNSALEATKELLRFTTGFELGNDGKVVTDIISHEPKVLEYNATNAYSRYLEFVVKNQINELKGKYSWSDNGQEWDILKSVVKTRDTSGKDVYQMYKNDDYLEQSWEYANKYSNSTLYLFTDTTVNNTLEMTNGIKHNLNIEMNGHTLHGSGNCGLLKTNKGDTLTISNGTLENGKAERGSAVYAGGGSNLFVNNCVIRNNECDLKSSSVKGSDTRKGSEIGITGAVFVDSENYTAKAEFVDTEFSNNKTNYTGAAISTFTGDIKATNCKFIANKANKGGGAISAHGSGGSTSCSFDKCVFDGNTTDAKGGALYFHQNTAKITNSKFYNNNAGSTGGAVCINENSDAILDISDSEFKYNHSDGNGGAIFFGALSSANHKLKNVTITNNKSRAGGAGIYCDTAYFKAADVELSGKVIIKDNYKDDYTPSNAKMRYAYRKRAILKVQSGFDGYSSDIYVSSTDSDTAVAFDANETSFKAFHADNGSLRLSGGDTIKWYRK